MPKSRKQWKRMIAIVRQMVYNIFDIIDALCYRTNINDVDTGAVPSHDSISCTLSATLPYGRVVLC